MGSFGSKQEDPVEVLFVKPFAIKQKKNKEITKTITFTLTPRIMKKQDTYSSDSDDKKDKQSTVKHSRELDLSLYDISFDINPATELIFKKLTEEYPQATAHIVICSIRVGQCMNPYQAKFDINIHNLITTTAAAAAAGEGKEKKKNSANNKDGNNTVSNGGGDDDSQKQGVNGLYAPVKNIPDREIINLSTSHNINFTIPPMCNDNMALPIYALPLSLETVRIYAGTTPQALNKSIMNYDKDWEILSTNCFMYQFITKPANFLHFAGKNIKMGDVIKSVPSTYLREAIGRNTNKQVNNIPSTTTTGKKYDDEGYAIVSDAEYKNPFTNKASDDQLPKNQGGERKGKEKEKEEEEEEENTMTVRDSNLKKLKNLTQSKTLISEDERNNLRLVKKDICVKTRKTLVQNVLQHISYAQLDKAFIDASSSSESIEILKSKILKNNNISHPIVINLKINYVVTEITIEEKNNIDFLC